MHSKILVSYNPLIADDHAWMPEELVAILALPSLRLSDRTARTKKNITISGFWVNREQWIGYPLFRKHGHKERRISREEYEALIDRAALVVDPFCSKPDWFEEKVKELDGVIRTYLKGHMPE